MSDVDVIDTEYTDMNSNKTDSGTLVDELLHVQEYISHLEQTLNDLHHRIQSKDQIIEQLSKALLTNDTPHNTQITRPVTQKYLTYKAKFLYYKEQKAKGVVGRDDNCGDGGVTKNWRDIKKLTDAMFDNEDESKRQQYVQNAIKTVTGLKTTQC